MSQFKAFGQARRDFSMALRLDPKNPFAHVNLAFNLQADGMFSVAWDLLTAAMTTCPQSAPIFEARGVVSLQVFYQPCYFVFYVLTFIMFYR